MYRIGAEELQSEGTALIYSLPNPDWLPVLRLMPEFRCTTLPFWARALPRDEPLPIPAGFASSRLNAWDERIDALWSVSARLCDCQVVRDARALAWKAETFDLVGTEVSVGSEIKGLVTTGSGNGRWLISTLLMADADEALRATLAAACNVARAEWLNHETPPERADITVLAAPGLQPALSALGFEYNGFDSALAIHLLDRSIDEDAVAPERWYVASFD